MNTESAGHVCRSRVRIPLESFLISDLLDIFDFIKLQFISLCLYRVEKKYYLSNIVSR